MWLLNTLKVLFTLVDKGMGWWWWSWMKRNHRVRCFVCICSLQNPPSGTCHLKACFVHGNWPFSKRSNRLKLKTEVFILKCFVDFSSSLESVLRHWWIAGISCRKHLWVSWLTYHLPLTSLNLFLRGTWACTTFMPHIRAAVCAKCAS